MKDTNVKIIAHYRAKLDDLVEVRANNHHPFKTKQAIIEQLIETAHKKECK